MAHRPRTFILVLAAVAVSVAVTGSASAAGGSTSGFRSAYAQAKAQPGADPQGANLASCSPSPAHPFPVVLVHGTFANKTDDWAAISPALQAAGYCVFALNYGSLDPTGLIDGTGEITASAGELANFVDQVLAATHASKVDIVGHSQGGMMPRYYIKNLGGAAHVDKLVGLVPSNHGTTLDGLTALAQLIPGATLFLGALCPACAEQVAGSAFITALNAGGETNPAVTYTVISTTHDEVVTPFTSAFLAAGPNVTNETVQDFCSQDAVEHVGIVFDPVAIQLVKHALDSSQPAPGGC